ncbi:MAG: SDR family NAD(P)-dependent oxidoreductase, partial [Cyanobacteria bacterium P01_G01_bin.19]
PHPPLQKGAGDKERELHLLTLSARSQAALQALVKEYQSYLSSSASLCTLKDTPSDKAVSFRATLLKDICYTASVKRSHFEHRLALVARDTEELKEQLNNIESDRDLPIENSRKIAFLFTGQGSQYIDMGKELYETQPVFKENCDRCFEILDKHLGVSLKDIVFIEGSPKGRSKETVTLYPLPLTPPKPFNIDDTEYTQPAIFTIEYALAQMWISWGIKPDVVMGHSIGEFVAATIAEVFSLEDAVKLVAHRGRLMQKLPSNGEMYVIKASEIEVNSVIKTVSGIVTIAAINNQENTVISGESEAVEQALAIFESQNIKTTKLDVSHPFHSPLMEDMLPKFRKIAQEVSYSRPQISFVSNVTGKKIDNNIATAEYWVNHICQPVRFADGMKALIEAKCNVFLEVGAKPILLGMARIMPSFSRGDRGGIEGGSLLLHSLRHGQSNWQSILSSVASIYINGIDLDWNNFYSELGQILQLPTYPFQRQKYWLSSKKKKYNNIVETLQAKFLQGNEIKLAKSNNRIWHNQISQNNPEYLIDHQVLQKVVFPSAGYIEMALSVGRKVLNSSCTEISNINFLQPLMLSESTTDIQLVLDTEFDNNLPSFEVFSLNNNSDWTNNCKGKISSASITNESSNLAGYKQEINNKVDVEQYYQDLAERGLEYGQSFKAIAELYNAQDKALGKIELPENLTGNNYIIHPVLLDACLQVAGAAIKESDDLKTYLPIEIESFTINCDRLPQNTIWSYAEVIINNANIYTINFELINEQQEVVATISGLKIKAVSPDVLNNNKQNIDDWLYKIEWRDCPLPVVIDNSFINLKDIHNISQNKFSELTSQSEFKQYLDVLIKLENISADYIVNAVINLGFDFDSQQLLSPSVEQLGISEHHEDLWQRILEILTEAGILKETSGNWQVVKNCERINIEEKYQQLLQQYPLAKAELTLLHRCASQLDKVLNGNLDPKELLFPDGDLSLTTNLYQDSPGAKVTNTLVAETIKQVLVDLSQDRTIKILEIGAGTGGTTAYVLPELKDRDVEYTFTDLSPLFLTKAEEKFQEYNFISYELLDIAKASNNNQTYDVIIAANVLHATADLKQTLANARKLLNPEGILILVEGTQPIRWFDLTFGMTDGWWKFTDKQLRANYPLISVYKWQEILLDNDFTELINLCNFDEVEIENDRKQNLQQAVIVAQASKNLNTGDRSLDARSARAKLEVASATLEPKALPPYGVLKDTPSDNAGSHRYLIFTDNQGIGEGISNYLSHLDREYILVTVGSDFEQISSNKYRINYSFEQCDRLFQELQKQNKRCNNIIYLQSIDSEKNKLDIDRVTNSVLYLTQAIIRNNIAPTNLYFITRNTVGIDKEITIEGLSQSSLHGLVKVINLEHPEINCNCIDLDSKANLQQQIDNIVSEIQTIPKAEQIAWRNNIRKVARLIPYQPDSELLTLPKDKPYQLSITQKGTPKNLQLFPLQRRQPSATEVEIRVKTTGLNFIDVLDTLGLLPFDKDWFGVECAGEIVAVGKDIGDFAVGDKVIALATGSFNQYVTVNRLMVAAKPDDLTWEEAVTIPANFLTASYAMETTTIVGANVIRPNSRPRILIHAAAGGTGMAVVQLAQLAGMEIFATASPSKWEHLHSLGIKYVMNSRNLDFAEEIMQLTNGEGVDIVFNSLSGEFIEKSLAILKDNGHFIEIGKRNLKSKAEITKIKPNISYSLIDLFTTAQQQPELIQSLLSKLINRFATGELKPLPYKTFNIRQTIYAFQYMQQAKHIGKIVINHNVDVRGQKSEVRNIDFSSISNIIKFDSSYLIAGGLGDLGLLTANWLVEKGAKYLILIGRNEPSINARQQINKLEQKNIVVKIIQADISDYNSLEKAIRQSPLPALAGIIHSAGVLDDGMLVNMNSERMKTVMNPKVLGAWNLHQLTKNIELDFFILFSSAASLLGSLGQTNHVVANTFLDTLAHYRQAQGLPALSLNWGAWSDIGAAAKRKVDRDMNLKGIGAIPPNRGLEILEKLIVQSNSQVGIIPIEWSHFINSGYNLPLVENFKQIKQNKNSQNDRPTNNFLVELTNIKPERQLKYLTIFLQKQVGKVLGLPVNHLPSISQGFFDIGMDSLMAIELKSKLETSLQNTIPSTAIFEHSNIEQLANYIYSEILNLEQLESETSESEIVETELSVEELESAIARELTDLESLL